MPPHSSAHPARTCAAAIPSSRRRHLCGPLVAAATLAGCVAAGLPTTELPPSVRYECQQGGPLTVLRAPDGRQAEASFADRRVLLSRQDSAAQEKYGNGSLTLYLEGEKALLTEDSIVVAGRCESVVELPVVPQVRY